jgi:hypothetical protein
MAVSKTTRFGVTRWTEDTDPWTRDDFDDDNAAIEAKAAGFLEGTLAARPAASAANARMLYRATDGTGALGVLFYSTGSAWLPIVTANPVERFSFNFAPGVSTVLASGWHPAGKAASGSYSNADTGASLSGGGWPSWLTVDTSLTSNDAGLLDLAAGEYVVSMTMRLDDSTQETPFPDGSIWTLGYTLTTSGAMLGSTNNPQNIMAPIAMSAAFRALGNGHSIAATVGTAGARWLKPFVHMGAGAGVNRQYQLRVDVAKLR